MRVNGPSKPDAGSWGQRLHPAGSRALLQFFYTQNSRRRCDAHKEREGWPSHAGSRQSCVRTESQTRNPKPGTWNAKSGIRKPKPETHARSSQQDKTAGQPRWNQAVSALFIVFLVHIWYKSWGKLPRLAWRVSGAVITTREDGGPVKLGAVNLTCFYLTYPTLES